MEKTIQIIKNILKRYDLTLREKYSQSKNYIFFSDLSEEEKRTLNLYLDEWYKDKELNSRMVTWGGDYF